MKVAVIGAGIGGMTLALALHDVGIRDVELFEAAPSVKELGVGINVLPHGARELIELGLQDELYATGIPTAELAYYSTHGQLVWAEPRGLAASYRWPQISIHRGELLGILHRAVRKRLGPGCIHTGHQLVRFRRDTVGGIWCEFAGAPSRRIEADLLVGCDGVHSAVRRMVFPNEGKPRWNGRALLRGMTVGRPFLSGRTMVMIGHTRHLLVAYPISKPCEDEGLALINWALIHQSADDEVMPPETWNHAVHWEHALKLVSAYDFEFLSGPALARGAEAIYQYPMVDRDPLPTWDFKRVTLVGDAAHPMYPLGSNGASQAIVDARVLAGELASQPSIEAAIAQYDAQRRAATAALVLANRQSPAERCLDLVEERAPNGFVSLDDVISHGELDNISRRYQQVAGFEPEVLNQRPSLSVSLSQSQPQSQR